MRGRLSWRLKSKGWVRLAADGRLLIFDDCSAPFPSVDHFRILGNGLAVACNGGSCAQGSIIKKRFLSFAFETGLPALASITRQYRQFENGLLSLLDERPLCLKWKWTWLRHYLKYVWVAGEIIISAKTRWREYLVKWWRLYKQIRKWKLSRGKESFYFILSDNCEASPCSCFV